MKNRLIVSINLIVILVMLGISVYREESNKKNSEIILALAPVDPRSLMQGDYMTLRYQIERDFDDSIWSKEEEGFIKVEIDGRGIANFVRVLPNYEKNTIVFTNYQKNFQMGIESYFFQEGDAKRYEKAKYARVFMLKGGELRIDKLLDKNFNDL